MIEKRYFVQGNILRFFFIRYIRWPLSAIASFKSINDTMIMFYRYFIIQCLYDFDIRGRQTFVHDHYHYENIRLPLFLWRSVLSRVCRGFVFVMEIFCTTSGHFTILLGRNLNLNPNSDVFLSHEVLFS